MPPPTLRLLFFFTIFNFYLITAKIHHLSLRDESRRNIILSGFGYDTGGTFDLVLSNFSVPDIISSKIDSGENAEKSGVIGFSLSRGLSIAAGVGSNPHVCQLSQTDQGYDAIFFIADLPQKRFSVYRSGKGKDIKLCPSHEACLEVNPDTGDSAVAGGGGDGAAARTTTPATVVRDKREGFLERFKNIFSSGDSKDAYVDHVPLQQVDNLYSANISIRFTKELRGKYFLIYHNCFKYRAHGYVDRVAVDFTIDLIEENVGSYLSAGDIPKPHLLLYLGIMFAFCGILWSHRLCLTSKRNIYRVHGLMTALVFLKALSLISHGVNYYFVSKYGHQREIWAVVFYITHLLKGALLFGTILLIGTGYTFFKNFLTERDRKVFMIVLPLQIIDNIAMIIMEESEAGQQGYQFWYEMFVFLDMICCFFIFFPIIWSMDHLQEGAKSDGKAAFNLQKLRLFRHFYILVIAYIYTTRILKFILQYTVPFDLEWITVAIVEGATLFFFILVGIKFRPQPSNPYLKLDQEEDDDVGIALVVERTRPRRNHGLTRADDMDGVVHRSRTVVEDIPGGIGGVDSDEDSGDEQRTLIGKRRMEGLEKTLL